MTLKMNSFFNDKTDLKNRWIAPVSLEKTNKHFNSAKQFINNFKETFPSLKKRTKDARKHVNHAFNLILCNFTYAYFERKNLIIPNRSLEYEKGGKLRKLFLTRRATREVLKALEDDKYISKIKGNSFYKKANEYKPLAKLGKLLDPLLYVVKEKYNKSRPLDYVIFREESNRERLKKLTSVNPRTTRKVKYIRGATSVKLTIDHPDVARLHTINCYLENVSYALKAPVKLIYTGDPFHGGRLYTRIQNLANRDIKIRINTLINNEKVCEIDLSANHPAIAMALKEKQLPKNFYETVSKETKLKFDLVKDYIRKAFGASDRRINLKKTLTKFDTAKIDNFISENFPGVFEAMYNDMGSAYQSLEGQILIRAMLALIKKDIPSLPIHDALMVPQRFMKEGRAALENEWKKEFRVKFKPNIKVNYP